MAAKKKVLLVSKKSTYDRYVNDERDSHFERLVEQSNPAVTQLRHAHDNHLSSLERAKSVLAGLDVHATFQVVGCESPEEVDLVVTLGGDGTLLWVSHIVGPDTPMLAVNTTPGDSVGYFCAGSVDSMADLVSDAVAGKLPDLKLSRMHVDVDGQVVSRRVLNDMLFCHQIPAATTRYVIDGEEHKSSGVWVGTAAGSTAALRSAGGSVQPLNSRQLQYVVREPYLGEKTRFTRLSGFIDPGESLSLLSKTPAGRVYLDGPYREHRVPFGSTLSLQLSKEPLTLLGLHRRTG